jgi:hypothetical protein
MGTLPASLPQTQLVAYRPTLAFGMGEASPAVGPNGMHLGPLRRGAEASRGDTPRGLSIQLGRGTFQGPTEGANR